MAGIILPSTLAMDERWMSFQLVAIEMLSELPLERLLVYFVDSVDASILPYLAEEFDVLGLKGWDWALDDAGRRDLIKQAITLHKYKGTPYAIDQVIELAGLTGGVLVEHSGAGPTGWAVFRITVDYGSLPLDIEQLSRIRQLVEIYKNARSVFEGVTFTNLNFTEDVPNALSDELTVNLYSAHGTDDMVPNASILYDGTWTYGDGLDHSGELDSFLVNIV